MTAPPPIVDLNKTKFRSREKRRGLARVMGAAWDCRVNRLVRYYSYVEIVGGSLSGRISEQPQPQQLQHTRREYV
eukprot:scaffold26520_cov67-Skeletonema_dohrnii-CCMP3373.AAC.1